MQIAGPGEWGSAATGVDSHASLPHLPAHRPRDPVLWLSVAWLPARAKADALGQRAQGL